MLTIEINAVSYKYTECGGFNFALYPAFLKALYYEPNTNIPLSGKGETYFGLGNWYIPDTREMERLIYYRINSSITDNSLTELAWNNTTASTNDVSGKGYNVFNSNTFSSIAFLKDQGAQITSVGTSEGEGYTYSVPDYYQSSPQWHVDCSEYGGSTCARDLSHNISPVCRIILTEAL